MGLNYITYKQIVNTMNHVFTEAQRELESCLSYPVYKELEETMGAVKQHPNPYTNATASDLLHKAMCVQGVNQVPIMHSGDIKQLLDGGLTTEQCLVEWTGVFNMDDWYIAAVKYMDRQGQASGFRIISNNRMLLLGYKAGLLEKFNKIRLGVSGKTYVVVPSGFIRQVTDNF